MKKTLILALLLLLQAVAFCQPIVLRNAVMSVQIERFGTSISALRLLSDTVNPLSWALRPDQMPPNNSKGAPFRGHFLCTGRWGAPSEEEIAAEVPHNGEFNNLHFKTEALQRGRQARLIAFATLEHEKLERTFLLDTTAPVLAVEDALTNLSAIGRIDNIVQHVTLGPPWLTANTKVYCNASFGYDQKTEPDSAQLKSFAWPDGALRGGPEDLRTANPNSGYVVSHVIDGNAKYGWLAAISPERGTILCYIWLRSQYPWVNIWNQGENGKMVAKGLEFGTTGFGKPYDEMLARYPTFHTVPNYFYHKARQTFSAKYLVVYAKLPKDMQELRNVEVTPTAVLLKGKDGKNLQVETRYAKWLH